MENCNSYRERLIQIFYHTMQLCNENTILIEAIKKSIDNQHIYWEEDDVLTDSAKTYDMPKIILSDKRTLQAAKAYEGKKVCILNFASFINPGGAVKKGTRTQEEGLCRISTLYPAISDKEKGWPFYQKHRELIERRELGWPNRDDCIYTPDVIVFKEDTSQCELMSTDDWYKVDVITCAAPDLRQARQRDLDNGSLSKRTLALKFMQRIKRILEIAIQHQAEVIVLGAFGCGAFQNPPTIVSYAYNEVLKEYKKYFDTIELAIYDRKEHHVIECFENIENIEKNYINQ